MQKNHFLIHQKIPSFKKRPKTCIFLFGISFPCISHEGKNSDCEQISALKAKRLFLRRVAFTLHIHIHSVSQSFSVQKASYWRKRENVGLFFALLFLKGRRCKETSLSTWPMAGQKSRNRNTVERFSTIALSKGHFQGFFESDWFQTLGIIISFLEQIHVELGWFSKHFSANNNIRKL